MIWNSKNTTMLHRGRKAYGFGDKIPASVIEQMGAGSVAEHIAKGRIVRDEPAAKIVKPAAVSEKDALVEKTKGLGLKPHYNAGVVKLKAMIDDYEALQALQIEALALGIEPSGDVTFEELTALVDEAKTAVDEIEDEPDH